MATYKNYLKPVNTQSGVAEYVLVAPMDMVGALANPVDEDSTEITTPHTFADAVNGGFIKLQGVPNKNSYANNSSGDVGLKRQNAVATAFIPGSSTDLHNTIKNLINVPLIVLQKDGNCRAGMYYQLGTDCIAAYLNEASFTTGTTADGQKGYMVTFEAAHPVLTYKPGTEPKIFADGGVTPPAVLDTALTFDTAVQDSAGNVTGTVAAINATQEFEFNVISSITGTPNSMTVKVGGAEAVVIDFPGDYLGKPFKYTHTTGSVHNGAFASGDVNF